MKIIDRIMEVMVCRSDRWLTSTEIASLADCHSGSSEPSVRKAIRCLIERGVPIVSCQEGFKIATHQNEVQLAVQDLRIRAADIVRRADHLQRSWRLWELGTKALKK